MKRVFEMKSSGNEKDLALVTKNYAFISQSKSYGPDEQVFLSRGGLLEILEEMNKIGEEEE